MRASKVFQRAREMATGPADHRVFGFVGEQARLGRSCTQPMRSRSQPQCGVAAADREVWLEVGDKPRDSVRGHTRGPKPCGRDCGPWKRESRRLRQARPAAPKAGKATDAFTRVGVWHIPAPTLSRLAPRYHVVTAHRHSRDCAAGAARARTSFHANVPASAPKPSQWVRRSNGSRPRQLPPAARAPAATRRKPHPASSPAGK